MLDPRATHIDLTDGVLWVSFDDPPLNLIGPDIVHDLVALVRYLETGPDDVKVVVFDSAVPYFFSAHVDMAQLPALREQLAELGPLSSTAMLYHRISSLPQITIAVIAGRVRGAGSEFALSCDLRFASRERAIFGQFEAGVGMIPGAGAAQHLPRLVGRGRAIEILVTGDDYPAELAERYGWINRALPDAELPGFVSAMARRIAGFPSRALIDTKRRVNDAALPALGDMQADYRLFYDGVARPETRERLATLFDEGLQTDGETERSLGAAVGRL